MSQQLLEQVQKHRREIKHEQLTYALSELINMHRSSEVVIQPDYQRLFRWTRAQQSSFIESLILEVPIPPLFFFENDDGRWELLDGLQRLSTAIKFMGTESDVPPDHQGSMNNDNEWHERTRNDIDVPLQLEGTDYLPGLEGLSFARLPTSLKLNLKRSRIQIYVLKRETDRSYKYEVFRRLNQGGSIISEQEVRNASTRLMDNEFPDFIRNIAKEEDFVAVLQLRDDDVKNAYVDELALRFFAMKNYSHNFKHDVSEMLTNYMENVAKKQVAFDADAETEAFKETWQLIRAAYAEDGAAFRARRADGNIAGPFSPTFFELMSLAVASNLDLARNLSPADLAARLEELKAKARADGLTGSGSNSKKKTMGRVRLAKGWLSG